MKTNIINKCKEYGYEFIDEIDNVLVFQNKETIEELQIFHVLVDEVLERISMALMVDMGSWNEASDCDLNDIEEINYQIDSWLGEYNLSILKEEYKYED